MVRLRGLEGNLNPTATATKAVAFQCFPLEVSASRPGTIWEDERGFPFVVFQIELITAGMIRLGRFAVVRRSRILKTFQDTFFVHCNLVAKSILAETLGSRYIFFPTYRFRRDPESFMVKPMSNFREVMGQLKVIRPATNDC